MLFSKDFSKAVQSFVKADLTRKQSAIKLAELISKEINSEESLTEWRKSICSLSEQAGNKAYNQAYRYPEKLAMEQFDWENPSQKHKPSKKGDKRRKTKPSEDMTISDKLKQALATACLELDDSKLLMLISKDNRIKSTIPIEVRTVFNNHIKKVLDCKE